MLLRAQMEGLECSVIVSCVDKSVFCIRLYSLQYCCVQNNGG